MLVVLVNIKQLKIQVYGEGEQMEINVKRLKNESYEDYKKRLRRQNLSIKYYLRGKFVEWTPKKKRGKK